MRFLVFLLGFVASLIVGAAGWFWIDYQSNRLIRNTLYDDHKIDIGIIMPDYTDFETTSWAAVFLVVGGALGLLGSLFTLFRRGRHGAVLMILAVVGPAVLNPLTLMFTGLLGFTGILSVFIGPRASSADEPA